MFEYKNKINKIIINVHHTYDVQCTYIVRHYNLNLF